MKSVPLATRPRRKERVLKQEAAGTAVLLDVDSGQYYAVNEVGGRVWDLCDGSRTLSEIAAIIGGEYDAPPETIERDVGELLTDLANEDLVG
ncbi:MAG: PqqD family protein [Limisphaerales bacterium]